ncbi:dienelactone hydrolase endo-1-3,1,4-beta-D-glucanase [Gloeopeniophorella convolvens]|nr:dienelactone hydrolase endo-1-3,1,4-beta-D-glucanase [Gloeopeniophorella convolvens]
MSCPDCYKGFILPGEPKGTTEGTAYFSPAPPLEDAKPTGSEKKAVVLLTDIFGLPLPNPRIIADHFAEELGIDVWVPDLFAGSPPLRVEQLEPYVPDRAGVKMSWWATIRLVLNALFSAHKLIAHRPSVAEPRVREFIAKIKADKGYERIGAVGYCFGGVMAARLGATDLVNTIVITHPGGISAAQLRAIKVPTSWALAQEDMGFKPKNAEDARAAFKEQEGRPDAVEYEFKVWDGTTHGFACRPNLAVPEVKAGYEGALEQTIAWFKKTL